jgi:hypothetical protein
MSEIQRKQESILVLDLGACNTKAVLLDLVEEQYRPVATAQVPSTALEPWRNLSFGAVEAVSRLEEICGRVLLCDKEPSEEEQHRSAARQLITPEDEGGSGVGRLLVVSSAGGPLRVLLAGGAHDISLASARRAIRSTYACVQGVVALEQSPGAGWQGAGAQVDTVLKSDADLILLVGGTDGSASGPMIEMAREVLRVALYLMGEDAPRVLYAGNQALADELTELLGNLAEVRVADNVRPTVQIEDLAPVSQALNSTFHQRKLQALPGLRAIREWSDTRILPTVRATETAIRCCAEVFETDKPALGIDLGSANVALHIAHEHRVRTTVRTDLGIGQSLLGLLDEVEMGEITRWLPFELEEDELVDWFHYKVQHPQTVPQTRRDLLIELAAARELLRLVLADLPPLSQPGEVSRREVVSERLPMAPPCDPIVGSGSLLARAPHPGLAALVLLDGLQPVGISTLYQDENSLLPALGGVAQIEPLATVQVLRGGGLLYLGTVVAPQGRARRFGAKALTVRSLDPEIKVDQVVGYGELCLLPASLLQQSSETPMLELIPTRNFDLGRGAGKSVQIPFRPGALGLIVDARGRPLVCAPKEYTRRKQMNEWLFTMTGERGA